MRRSKAEAPVILADAILAAEAAQEALRPGGSLRFRCPGLACQNASTLRYMRFCHESGHIHACWKRCHTLPMRPISASLVLQECCTESGSKTSTAVEHPWWQQEPLAGEGDGKLPAVLTAMQR